MFFLAVESNVNLDGGSYIEDVLEEIDIGNVGVFRVDLEEPLNCVFVGLSYSFFILVLYAALSLLSFTSVPSKSALIRSAFAFATALDRREDAVETMLSSIPFDLRDFDLDPFLIDCLGFRFDFRLISSEDVACRAECEDDFLGFLLAFRLISFDEVAYKAEV